jgi:hypothetical protein
MVSDLSYQLKRILPFAEKAIEDSVEESTDLLRRTIARLYTAIMDVAQFACVYVKQSRVSTYIPPTTFQKPTLKQKGLRISLPPLKHRRASMDSRTNLENLSRISTGLSILKQ